MKLVELPKAKDPEPIINAELVAQLEIYLEMAKAGNIESMAFAFVSPEGAMASNFTDPMGQRRGGLIAAVSILKHRLLSSLILPENG
jgi:hypothetical protein